MSHQKRAAAEPPVARAAELCMPEAKESTAPARSGCQLAAAELAAAGTGKAVQLAAEALSVDRRADTAAWEQAGERPPEAASRPAEYLDAEDAIDTVAEVRTAVVTGTAVEVRIAAVVSAEAAVYTASPPAGSGSCTVAAAVQSSDRAAAIAVAKPAADASESVIPTMFRTSTASSRHSMDTD